MAKFKLLSMAQGPIIIWLLSVSLASATPLQTLVSVFHPCYTTSCFVVVHVLSDFSTWVCAHLSSWDALHFHQAKTLLISQASDLALLPLQCLSWPLEQTRALLTLCIHCIYTYTSYIIPHQVTVSVSICVISQSSFPSQIVSPWRAVTMLYLSL